MEGCRVADFRSAEIFERKIRGHVERERALLVDRHSHELLREPGDQRSLVHEDPSVPAPLKLGGSLGERLGKQSVADLSLVGHHGVVAHRQWPAFDRLERGVRVAELLDPFLHVRFLDHLLRQLDGERRVIRQLELRGRHDARPVAHGLVVADLDVLDFRDRQDAEVFLFDRLVDAVAQKLFFQLLADVLREARVDQRLGSLARTVSGDPGLALEIFGNGLPFTRHLVGGKLDLKVDDTIGLWVTNDIHGQSAI